MRLTSLAFAFACSAAALTAAEQFQTAAGVVKITPIRHASLMLEAGGKVIHLDPWSQGTQEKYAALPKADLLLITDSHPDHMDAAAIGWVTKPGTAIIAPSAVTSSLKSGEAMKNGETRKWGAFTIEAVPMYNLKRGPQAGAVYHDKGRGNGYIVTYGGKRFYFSGDTEAVPEMKALKNIDVAFICMNTPYTMPPDEAAEGVKAFAPKIVYPYHYRGSDLKIFVDALKGLPIEVRLLDWYK